MIRYSTFLILCVLLFLFAGCGKGPEDYCNPNPHPIPPNAYEPIFDYDLIQPSTSSEFFEYLDTWPEEPSDFIEYWKIERGNDWSFIYWTDSFLFVDHRYESGEQIWNSKKANCHRLTIILLEKYEGEYCYIAQDYTGEDHACFQGKDKDGIFYISFSGLKVKFCRKFADIYELETYE